MISDRQRAEQLVEAAIKRAARPKRPDYSECYFKIDKYMHDEDQADFHAILNKLGATDELGATVGTDEAVKDLARLIDDTANERLYDYLPNGGTVEGLAQYIVAQEVSS